MENAVDKLIFREVTLLYSGLWVEKSLSSEMFEKNLTDLVRGIRNNKSNEVRSSSSHEHIVTIARFSLQRGKIFSSCILWSCVYSVLNFMLDWSGQSTN